MNYPLISEYIDSIKSAEDNFDRLSNLRPVLDDNGEPVMSSGNFAVVFKMADGKRDYAIKCFLKEQEGREDSYRKIAEELECINSDYLCRLEYLPGELFVDSANCSETEFPVLKMDWVEGVTLDKYVHEHIADDYALALLAYRFCKMAAWLMTQPFAHGDLKPDNILVRDDGNPVLVDYDGFYVPSMEGEKARELGSPDYRHPLRTEESFNEHIDDFSLASIALSLKAISLNKELCGTADSNDSLLFHESDYRDLSKSTAVAALQPLMNDKELNRLYALFLLAHSEQKLSNVSFRLFNIVKPKKEDYVVELLSTKVTKEDLADAWEDEFGVKYSKDGKRLLKAPKDIVNYAIKRGTIVICDGAFYGCSSLASITLPNSVTQIGECTFCDCSSLKSIIIPNSVTHIEFRAFHGCSSLESIIIPNSVTQIGSMAFYGCSSLESIIIPNSATQIGDEAFAGCPSLKSITIPNSVTQIGDSVFCRCSSLKSIIIPNSVTQIGDEAFDGCSSLESIVIPNSVTQIGYSAFYGCSSLESIVIPNSVTQIGIWIFYGCSSLKSIIIPNSVTQIGDMAFHGCSSLTSIIIPNSVTHIGDMAFHGCSSLKSIIIPNSVTHIGDMAFHGCSSLKSITIPTSVVQIGQNPFTRCSKLKTIKCLSSKFCFENDALYGQNCTRLIAVLSHVLNFDIPNTVTHIGDSAFYSCSSLESIIIPDSVTQIEDWAFSGCSSLESITLPPSVTHIGEHAFGDCSSLESIIIPPSVTQIGDLAFYGCSSLVSITISNSVTQIEGGKFWSYLSLRTINIPRGSKDRFKDMLGAGLHSKLVEIDI